MNRLICAVCDQEAVVVCHHCGRPLCETHHFSIWDDQFQQEGERSARAMHCPACLQAYHRRSAFLTRLIPRRLLSRFLPE